VLLCLLIIGCGTAVADETPLHIGTITIMNLEVFSPDEASHGPLYRIADRLHVVTRRSVIKGFLLFHEGDEYRPERLAETERNLRAQRFLKSASVVATAPHDGVVDVIVTTQDGWSIEPETQAGNRGGTASYGAVLAETNLLGYGKTLQVGWDRNVDRSGHAVDYQDPAFFAPYWNARFTYGQNSDGYNHRITIRRPFYSFATPWSVDLTFNAFRQTDRLYGDGVLAERFQQQEQRYNVSFGRALTNSDVVANRLVMGVRYVRDDFARLPRIHADQLPGERDLHYVFVRYEHAENDFVKLNFVNRDLRYEDFNLGNQYSIEAAVSPRLLGADANSTFVRVTDSNGYQFGKTTFVIPSAAAESRIAGGFHNAIATGSVNLIKQFEGEHPSALVGRVGLTNGWNLDGEIQFFADGLTGLRGYRAHAFSGARALMMNLEQRFYLGQEIMQLVSPGVAVFADAGNATSESFPHLFNLKTDVGVGIRLGLPRTPRNLIRIDFAYALNRDPRGKRGLLISVASGQAF
jgi:hypothetical protein